MNTSKKLGNLMRQVPPATASEQPAPTAQEAAAPPTPLRPVVVEEPAAPAPRGRRIPEDDPYVATQLKLPRSVRRQLDHMNINTGEELRVLVMRAIRSLGITVTDEQLKSRRKRQ